MPVSLSSEQEVQSSLSAHITFDFAPCSLRARALDELIRSRLATSLEYIYERADGQLQVPPAEFHAFLRQLKSYPISPTAFCLYSDVVFAIERDALEEAIRAFHALMALPIHPAGPQITFLPDPKVDAQGALYARIVDSDPETPFAVFSPSPAVAHKCNDSIEAAFRLLKAADAEQEAELRGLLREVVLAVGTGDKSALTFDGASSFLMWGGIIINADRDDGPVEMVQMLVHEGAHNLLFGLCHDALVVENGPDERYASPLRLDPRPLEGIFHATFVLARMYRALQRLVLGGVLSHEEKQNAEQSLERLHRNFDDGLSVLRNHARLTQRGSDILRGASAFMADTASPAALA